MLLRILLEGVTVPDFDGFDTKGEVLNAGDLVDRKPVVSLNENFSGWHESGIFWALESLVVVFFFLDYPLLLIIG